VFKTSSAINQCTKKSNKKVDTCEKKSQYLGADYMDRASPVNRAEKCHENLPWAAK
jgi:hypothetical protein